MLQTEAEKQETLKLIKKSNAWLKRFEKKLAKIKIKSAEVLRKTEEYKARKEGKVLAYINGYPAVIKKD